MYLLPFGFWLSKPTVRLFIVLQFVVGVRRVLLLESSNASKVRILLVDMKVPGRICIGMKNRKAPKTAVFLLRRQVESESRLRSEEIQKR
ncbi:hypothetical protein CEXT_601741 [Caerostris extrusa]|uniref:Secreted protein n=1 Tax=Caerostris extrusa TaxID=172846 RepID=A0AAV4MLR7_CAEEX|nr:hypothetical protein CEXT_601741 [Caerostris extrusa]